MLEFQQEYYVRYILLLLKGGSHVLQKLVIKGLEKRNITLQTCLDKNRATICKSEQISDFQRDLLYPPSGSPIDITKWDTSLLIYIILECLRECFSESEIASVERLRSIRHAFYAHHTEAEVDCRKFPQLWSELSLVITTISHSFKDSNYYTNLISSISSVELDTNSVVQELKELASTDEFFEAIHTSLCVLERSVQQSQRNTADPCGSQDNSSTLLREKMEQVNITKADVGSKKIDKNSGTSTDEDEHDRQSFHSDTDSMQTKDGQEQFESPEAMNKEKIKKRKKNKKSRRHDRESKRPKLQLSSFEEHGDDSITRDTRDETGTEMERKTLTEENKRSNDAMDVSLDAAKKQEMVFGAFREKSKDFQTEIPAVQGSTCSLFKSDARETDISEVDKDDKNGNANKKGEGTLDTKVSRKITKKTETDKKMKPSQTEIKDKSEDNDDKDGHGFDSGVQTRSTRNRTKNATENSSSFIEKQRTTASNNDERDTSKRGQSQVEEMMKVQFHVLISPDFKFDQNLHKVVIGVRSGFSKEWDVDKHHMKIVSEHSEGHVEMTYTLDVPKPQIKGGSGLVYKYFIVQNKENKSGKIENKGSWERYYVKGKDEASSNRTVQLPTNEKSTFWHQFDGIANKKDSSLKRALRDMVMRNSLLKHDADIAMQTFGSRIIQSITHTNASPAAILGATEMTNQLLQGLRKTYFIDAQCFTSEDETQKRLGGHLFDQLFKLFKGVSAPRTEQQWKRRMTLQFELLDIWERMKLGKSQMSLADTRKLCKAFLISPSRDKRTCKELEFISEHFPTKKNFFRDALLSLARVVVEQAKDPSWLYLMPLVHFLSGACSPYDKVSNDITHDDEVPTWWGLTNVSINIIHLFKKYQTLRWEISRQDILETLQPLFEIDFLLPRTMMACLNLSELYEIISSKMIPVEVCCAALVFHLRKIRRRYPYEKLMTTDEQIVYKCIMFVEEQLQQDHQESNRQQVCKSWLLPWATASDLLIQSLQRNGHEITSHSIHVFLLCASNYYHSIRQTSPECEFQDIASYCQETIYWLTNHFNPWHSDLERCLQVWNDCMVQHAVIQKDIEQLWNMSIGETLQKTLSHVIQEQPFKTEKIVVLYCKKIDSYKPDMQNCLYGTALGAIDKSCDVDVQYFDQYQRKRYGELLSKMFDIEWSKMMKNVPMDDNRKFLEQILEWSPFPHFMNIFVAQQQWPLLNEECRNKLMTAISIIETFIEHLLTGLLTVGDLQLIHKHAEKFADVASLVKIGQQQNEITKETVHLMIQVRKKELDKFMYKAELIVSLKTLCKSLTQVDVSAFDEVLEKKRNIESHG